MPIAIATARLMLAASWVASRTPNTRAAQAAAPTGNSVASLSVQAPGAIKRYEPCVVVEVGTGKGTPHNYVLVTCKVADGNIKHFTTDTSDSRFAARVLSIALTAQATASKTVYIDYDPADTAGLQCDASICRKISSIGFFIP